MKGKFCSINVRVRAESNDYFKIPEVNEPEKRILFRGASTVASHWLRRQGKSRTEGKFQKDIVRAIVTASRAEGRMKN